MQKIKEKLEAFDRELTEVGLRIYERHYVATAALLTYCSVLRFNFQGRVLPRGWLDILILGDTRCGKSAIVEGIVSGIRMGEFLKCENTSFAGLVGGLQQIGSRTKWDIVWGKIPLNNGKLLAADEMSSLDLDDIGNMSAVRSSGVAEVVKVQSGITRAATRLIWISNPRSDRSMSSYTFGVHAVAELIGRPEDIARFDFVVGVRSDDVPISKINANVKDVIYAARWDELRNLVRWIWSLRPQDVIFSDKTIEAVLSTASEQSKTYCSSVPLVEPNEQRIRVARVATAVAGRCYSEQGGKLIVKPEHVEYADFFMRSCFNSRAIGYKSFSDATKQDAEEMARCSGDVITQIIRFSDKRKRGIKLLLSVDSFSMADMETFFNLPRMEARHMLSMLMQEGCVIRKKGQHYKTEAGIRVLEKARDMKV